MLIKQSILFLLIVWLTGCSNAVSYHHTERNSIALEVSPSDPQQPVQGIIGIKTRTIVVAPGITDPLDPKNNGESASVISDFKLKREESKDFFGFGTTVIQSAFITGEAAKKAPPSAAKALSGLGIDGVADSAIFKRTVMANIYRFLEQNKSQDDKAKKYLQQLDKLLELLPEDYVNNTYYMLNGNILEKKMPANYIPKPQAFLEVLNYEQVLVTGSIETLEKMQTDRKIKYKASGGAAAADITAKDLAMFEAELTRLKAEKQNYAQLIGSHLVIDMAAAYMTSFL